MDALTLPVLEHGHLGMTPSIAALMRGSDGASKIVRACLRRHLTGDCGDMCEDDVLANLRAFIRGGERVFSSYKTAIGKVWIITEADRSATTILFPHEY
jgi:hypothetical protein